MDFLVSDPKIKLEETLFVDDIPHRIKRLPDSNIIVAEKFNYKNNDNYLLNLIEILNLYSDLYN